MTAPSWLLPSRPLRVLHVENELPITRILTEVFRSAGVPIELTTTYPVDPNLPALEWPMPSAEALNQFDFALLDIELLPTPTTSYLRSIDLQGGSVALPYLRHQAPWLPVLAYSRLLDPSLKWWNLPAISGFRFDGLISRSAINNRELVYEPLAEWLHSAELSRCESAYGPSSSFDAGPIVINCVSKELELKLAAIDSRWQDLVYKLFPFAKSVLLSSVQSGWSGAIVAAAHVTANSSNSNVESRWLVKISRNVWNLSNEARAHVRMQRTGVSFATSTNLLWRIPITLMRLGDSGRFGALAYQFADQAETLLSIVEAGGVPAEAGERIAAMVNAIYSAPRREMQFVRGHLANWLPSSERLEHTCSLLDESSTIRKILFALASGSSNVTLDRQVRAQRTLIHGDLHLGNIMYGTRDALVDYALSNDGPIAVDIGKLAADILVRSSIMRISAFDENGRPSGDLQKALTALLESTNFDDADFELLFLFVRLRVAQYLRHMDVGEDTKEWIRSFCQ